MAAPAQTAIRAPRSRRKEPDDSLLKTLGRQSLSGLAAGGNFIDLAFGASSLRDIAVGENPLDQFLTPFSSENRVSGRDVLEHHKLLGRNKPGLDWGDVAGFAAEVAFDPSTYVGGIGLAKSLGRGGATLAKASPAVRKLSRTARMTTKVRDLATQIPAEDVLHAATGSGFADTASFLSRHGDEPVGGLLSLHTNPFGGPVKAIGTGPMAQKIGGGLDRLGEAVRYSAPVRIAAANLSRANRGALSKAGQGLGEVAHAGEEAAFTGAGEAFAPHLRAYEEHLQALPDFKSRLDANDALRAAFETRNASPSSKIPLPQSMAHLQPIVDEIGKVLDARVPYEASEGVRAADLADIHIDYLKRIRHFFAGDKAKKEFPSLLLSGKHGSQIHREDILRDIGGGTGLINRLSVNPDLAGLSHTLPPATLENKAFWDQQETLVNAAMQQAGFPNWTYEHSRELAKWLADLDPRHVSEGIPVFPHNPVEEAMRRVEIGDRAVNMARAIRETLGQKGNHFTMMNAPPGAVRASRVFEAAGLDPQKSLDLLHEGFRGRPATALREGAQTHKAYASGASGYAATAKAGADDLNRRMVEMAEQAGGLDAVKDTPEFMALQQQWERAHEMASASRGIAGSAREVASGIRSDLNDVWIPKELAEDVGRVAKTFRYPDEVNAFLKFIDQSTALFKTGVTSIAPAFHLRNRYAGAVQNFLIGAFSPKASRAVARLVRKGQSTPGLYQKLGAGYAGLSDEAAMRKFADEAFAHGVAPRGQGIGAPEVRGTTLDRSTAMDISGFKPMTYPGALKRAIPRRGHLIEELNPLNIAGVRTDVDVNSVVAAAHDVGHLVESQNRLESYLSLRLKGYSPEIAAARTKAAHVDYNLLTDAERNVLRRWIPFYTFCVPTDHEILTRRGWKRYDEIVVGEDVLSLVPQSGEYEWVPLEAVNVFPYSGEMLAWETVRKNKSIRFEFTPQHNWLTERPIREYLGVAPDGRPIYGKQIGWKREFRTGATLSQGDKFVATGEFQGTDSILSPRLAAILGWVVTDGYWRRREGPRKTGRFYTEMIVYQSPKKHLSEIESLLGNSRRKPHPESGVCAVNVSAADVKEILAVCQNVSDLPSVVCRLSREAAEAMKDAMFKAEGSTSVVGNRHFAQDPAINPSVREAFQILCVLTGQLANMSSSGCYIRKCPRYSVRKQVSSFDYQGFVWCPTTKWGTWVMRHDGCVVVTGNSRHQAEFLVKELVDRPGGRFGQAIRMSNQGRSDEPLPEHVAQGMAVPLGELPDGTQRFVSGIGFMHEQPLSLLSPNPTEMLQSGLSQLGPIPKYAIEAATGESLFQRGPLGGRELYDQDPTLGRLASNVGELFGAPAREYATGRAKPVISQEFEQFAANLPTTRMASTLRTLTDPRKYEGGPFPGSAAAANVLTGLRVADVSPAARESVLREEADRMLMELGTPSFKVTRATKAQLAAASPEERETLLRLNAIKDELTALAKARKAQKIKRR